MRTSTEPGVGDGVPASVVDRLVRLELSTGGVGCGVLVGNGWLLTCHHVLPTRSAARHAVVRYAHDDPERYRRNTALTDPRRRLDARSFQTWPELDVTVAALGSGGQPGPLPVDVATPSRGEELLIAECHPARPGGVRLTRVRVANLTERSVQYHEPTVHGSSGAPVFNHTWELIALHHKRAILPGADGATRVTGQAVRIDAIGGSSRSGGVHRRAAG